MVGPPDVPAAACGWDRGKGQDRFLLPKHHREQLLPEVLGFGGAERLVVGAGRRGHEQHALGCAR